MSTPNEATAVPEIKRSSIFGPSAQLHLDTYFRKQIETINKNRCGLDNADAVDSPNGSIVTATVTPTIDTSFTATTDKDTTFDNVTNASTFRTAIEKKCADLLKAASDRLELVQRKNNASNVHTVSPAEPSTAAIITSKRPLGPESDTINTALETNKRYKVNDSDSEVLLSAVRSLDSDDNDLSDDKCLTLFCS